MQQSLIGLAPRRKATQFMPSARLMEFSTLISTLLKPGFCPENNAGFAHFLNGVSIDPSVLNAALLVNGELFVATRTTEGLFEDGDKPISFEDGDKPAKIATAAVDIDLDYQDLKIIARGDLPEGFAKNHQVQWYDANMNYYTVRFRQVEFTGTNYLAKVEDAKTQNILLFIAERDEE